MSKIWDSGIGRYHWKFGDGFDFGAFGSNNELDPFFLERERFHTLLIVVPVPTSQPSP
jgi:hypothetical protein